MFGLYRTLLALLVVAHHLLGIPVLGHYAVHGFFMLSGYLMTYIMHHSYGYTSQGRLRFAVNRFLRLYPSYWVMLLLSVIIILIFGENNSTAYRYYMYIPDSLLAYLQNISLIYLSWMPGTVAPRLSPPTWALTIELLYYLLIALGISKNKKATTLWVIAGIGYFLSTHLLHLGYNYRYAVIFSGTLPFSIGALIYHNKEQLGKAIEKYSGVINFNTLFTLILANAIAAVWAAKSHSEWLENIHFYTNYFLNGLLIIYLINGKPPLVTKRVDKLIGDYSYPIYLFHWQAGFAVSMLLWDQPIINTGFAGIINFILAIVLTVIVSGIVIRLIDRPIERYRNKIKHADQV